MLHIPVYRLSVILLLSALAQSRQVTEPTAFELTALYILYGAALEWGRETSIHGRFGGCADAFWMQLEGPEAA
jgi:hypothetical protein